MSDSLRQRNVLGSGFDWDIIYDAFKHADFKSYDYDSVYRSMVSYIRAKYGDEFNDFIKSSEVFAHVNMMSFLGQNIAMRIDINSEDNFPLKAKRRDNIINIAHMLSVQPRRNRPARGLLKIVAIETTESVKDSNHENISSTTIMWDQQGVFDWYDRFSRVVRSALSPENPMGFPHKRLIAEGVDTQVYRLNQYPSFDTNYYFEETVEGEPIRFNVVPTTIVDNEVIEEAPDSRTPFSIVYQSDGKGNKSEGTGFFVQFKEGRLLYNDHEYEHPKYHRKEVIDVININNDDVWLQQIDDNEETLHHWTKVSSDTGQNIIYNDIAPEDRKLYFVKTREGDRIEIVYGDSNFADVPLGKMRTWYRTSKNIDYTIPRDYIKGVPVEVPYIGRDGRQYILTLYLSNTTEIDNAQSSPTNQEIISSAPESRFVQDRMVNERDYNVYPISQLPFIRKMKTKNRDNSTKSRYPHLDVHDPTGSHSDLVLNADDGYIYEEYYETYSRFLYDEGKIDRDSFTQTTIEELLARDTFKNFYINHVFYKEHVADPTRFDLRYSDLSLRWMNGKKNPLSTTGYLYYYDYDVVPSRVRNVLIDSETSDSKNKLVYIRTGSKIMFETETGEKFWTTIIDLRLTRGYTEVVLSDRIPDNALPRIVIPGMKGTLRPFIRDQIERHLLQQESFGLRYNFEKDTWTIIPQSSIRAANEDFGIDAPATNNDKDDRWLIKCIFNRDITTEYYDVVSRGSRMIFGSERQARFYFSSNLSTMNNRDGTVNRDYVTVLKNNAFVNPDLVEPESLFVSRLNFDIKKF